MRVGYFGSAEIRITQSRGSKVTRAAASRETHKDARAEDEGHTTLARDGFEAYWRHMVYAWLEMRGCRTRDDFAIKILETE